MTTNRRGLDASSVEAEAIDTESVGAAPTTPRSPAREITFVDGDAITWASGPSDPPCLADGPGTVVEVEVDAKPADVWAAVTDLGISARFSDESLGATWADGFDGPLLGAEFIGRNQHRAIGEWEVPCFVNRFVDGEEFGWVTSDPDHPGAQWLFEVAPTAGGTQLRYSLTIGPGPSGISAAIENMPDKEPAILNRRVREHRANMQRVLDGVKAELHEDPDPDEQERDPDEPNPNFD